MRVWLLLVYKFTENYCCLQLFSEFIQTQKRYPTSWQYMYPNLKTMCCIKLKFFLWSKLLENLLLANYIISVAVPLRWQVRSEKQKRDEHHHTTWSYHQHSSHWVSLNCSNDLDSYLTYPIGSWDFFLLAKKKTCWSSWLLRTTTT